MERHPLLVFKAPETELPKGKLPRGGAVTTGPGRDVQITRIFSRLSSVSSQFAEHIRLTESPEGLVPEKVLVLEVAGDVSNLAKALANVEGFQFLANYVDPNVPAPDIFFTDEEDKRKPSTLNLYLSMSNQAGLLRLKTLWERFAETGDIERGYAPLKEAFDQLADIRFWDARDRIESTYLLEDWAFRLEDALEGDEIFISFEIELWFRPDPSIRTAIEARIRRIIRNAGGDITYPFVHEGIHYHALIGTLPLKRVREVLNSAGQDIELMRCDEVMFFRPLGQCFAPLPLTEEDNQVLDKAHTFSDPDPQLMPTVALLDGLPLENHTALKNRLIIDDPDGFESLYHSASEQVHGTAMASMIIHGDLSLQAEPALLRRLYVRPIMAPQQVQIDGSRPEQIPSAFLPVDLIHRAVHRMKVGDEGSAPAAPGIKVINLSIGDRYRLFDSRISPWARMLDWLSEKYDVLFVVSAGNMAQEFVLEGIDESILNRLPPDELEEHVIAALARQRQERRMMSPAESINAVTVSASHHDHHNGTLMANRLNLFTRTGMFSPINPITLGRKNAVKPEIQMPGGRQAYVNKSLRASEDVRLSPAKGTRFGPGIKCALPSATQGGVNTYGYTAGTSNATALATRRLALLYETLQEMKDMGYHDALKHAPDAVVLKALLVHGAEQDDAVREMLTRHLRNPYNSRTFNSELHQFLGFGGVNEGRIHGCLDNQATLLHTGIIKGDETQEFRFPLPKSLASKKINRRLIVTLAWLSPVKYEHVDYRGAQLWVSPEHERVGAKKSGYYASHLRHGTIFHDIRKGSAATPFLEGDTLSIKVHCKARAGIKKLKVPYALVVTLDTPGVNIPIYAEVREALRIPTQQRV